MKKVFVTIALGMALFATAACGSSDKPKTDIGSALTVERETTTSTSAPVVEAPVVAPAPVVEAPTTTTTFDNSAAEARIYAICSDAVSEITDTLPTISDGLSSIAYVDAATAHEFLVTTNEFIGTAISTMQSCVKSDSSFKPFLNSLIDVRTALKTVL